MNQDQYKKSGSKNYIKYYPKGNIFFKVFLILILMSVDVPTLNDSLTSVTLTSMPTSFSKCISVVDKYSQGCFPRSYKYSSLYESRVSGEEIVMKYFEVDT